MKDFNWKLEDIAEDIENIGSHIKTCLVRPHVGIWPVSSGKFDHLTSKILNGISDSHKNVFFSCCLASYLLNPAKAPPGFDTWFQQHSSALETMGVDLAFEELLQMSWGRVAIALAVPDSRRGKIAYAMTAVSKGNTSMPLMPEWVSDYFDDSARHAVLNAASLVSRAFQHNTKCFFWPMASTRSGQHRIEGTSLGLPVMLAFMSLVNGLMLPEGVLATGALNEEGQLLPADLLEEKLAEASSKGFHTFIYPLLGNFRILKKSEGSSVDPIGAVSRQHASEIWRSLDKNDPLNVLSHLLKPISFDNDIAAFISDFTGRNWIIEKIDRWAADPNGSRFFWLTGGPGLGKSSIAAWICSNRYYISASHFCTAWNQEKNNPKKMITSLACQLAFQLPQYQERLARLPVDIYLQDYDDPYTLFNKLIFEPLSDDFAAPEICCVLLIDALDEATSAGRNEFASLLSRISGMLPAWLRFLITSRPEMEITQYQFCTPCEIISASKDNHDDLVEYLQNQLPDISKPQLESIVQRSEGCFLYIKHICYDIRIGHLSLLQLDAFPKGLNAVYHSFFERQFKDISRYKSEIRPLLYLIASAFEPLSPNILKQITGIKSQSEFDDRLDMLGTLFNRDQQDVIRPYHLSLINWLTQKEFSGVYCVSTDDGHNRMADYGLERYRQLKENLPIYFLAWLPKHLVVCAKYDEAVSFLKDFNIMMKRAEVGLLERMLADYRTVKNSSLTTEAAFFSERSHILRRGTEFWPVHKILLQLAIEHADTSPLTIGAEQFLADGKCAWVWMRRELRPSEVTQSSCVEIIEVVARGAIELSKGGFLSWSGGYDSKLSFWGQTGELIKQHSGERAIKLSDGRILSWSNFFEPAWDDNDEALDLSGYYFWNNNGELLKLANSNSFRIRGVTELSDGRILSWSDYGEFYILNINAEVIKTVNANISVQSVIELSDGKFISTNSNGVILWAKDGEYLMHITSRISEEGLDSKPLEISTFWISKTYNSVDEFNNECADKLYSEDEYDEYFCHEDEDGSFYEDEYGTRIFENECGNFIYSDEKGYYENQNEDGNPIYLSGEEICCEEPENGRIIRVLDKNNYMDITYGALQLSNGNILTWADCVQSLCLWNNEGVWIKEFNFDDEQGSFYNCGAIELADSRILTWWSVKLSSSCHEDIDTSKTALRFWTLDGEPLKQLQVPPVINEFLPLSDGTILCWLEAVLYQLNKNGELLRVLRGHEKDINGATQFQDGRVLSWDADNQLRIWDLNNENPIFDKYDDWNEAGIIKNQDLTCHSMQDAESSGLTERDLIRVNGKVVLFSFSTDGVSYPAWHGDSSNKIHFIRQDGRIVCSQANSEPFELQTYKGDERATLNELDIRSGWDIDGFNIEGFDIEGYNRKGFNIDGFNRDGFNISGFDRDGYDRKGFNNNGFDRDGNYKIKGYRPVYFE